MTFNNLNSGFNLANWSNLAQIGSVNAITGLSQMINQEIKITALNLEEVSIRNSASLIGKPDDLIVGIYLMFSGNASGHIMLAFQPHIAFELVDMAMGNPAGSTVELGEMERSVLGELGNVVGSFFLNAVADHANLRLLPSPPVVAVDMVGAIIGSVIAEALADTESIFVIKLSFSTPDRQLEGRFLVLPNFDSPAATPKNREE